MEHTRDHEGANQPSLDPSTSALASTATTLVELFTRVEALPSSRRDNMEIMLLGRLYAADVEIGDLVIPLDREAAPPGRKVVRIEIVGPDELVFHYDDDGEPETYDAKTELLVTR